MSKPDRQGGPAKAAEPTAAKAARALRLGRGMSSGAKLGAGILTLVTGTAGWGVYQFTKSSPDTATETASTESSDESAKLIPTDVVDKPSTRLMSSLENAPPPTSSSPAKDWPENPWARKDAATPVPETTKFGGNDPAVSDTRPAADATAPSPWSRPQNLSTAANDAQPSNQSDAAPPPGFLPDIKPANAPPSKSLRSSPDRPTIGATRPIGTERILSSGTTADTTAKKPPPISDPPPARVAKSSKSATAVDSARAPTATPSNPCLPVVACNPCPVNPCPINPCPPNPCISTGGNSNSPKTFAPYAAPKTSGGRPQVPTLARELRSLDRTAETDVPVQSAAFNAPTPARAKPDGTPVNLTDNDSYLVLPDDSYWTIAETVYGDGEFHRALAEHNRRKFSGRRLAVGDEISTPSAAVLRRLYPWLCPREI